MHFEYLNAYHNKAVFDCGNDGINHYLKTMANQHHKKGCGSGAYFGGRNKYYWLCCFNQYHDR